MITLIRGVAIVTTAGLISLSAITMMRAGVEWQAVPAQKLSCLPSMIVSAIRRQPHR